MRDPNENLSEQRRLAEKLLRLPSPPHLRRQYDNRDQTDYYFAALRLAELVLALDTWLTQGGELPAAWTRKDRS